MNMLTKKIMGLLLATMTVATATMGVALAEEPSAVPQPKFPEPTAKHAWLENLVGEWEGEVESVSAPGQPPVKTEATEVVKPVGDFWIISENEGTMMDKPFKGVMTLGFDAKKEKYVGTWVDSMTGTLWNYEGTVDDSGKKLTLESEGTCPMQPGKVLKFKDVTELKDDNTKVMTSKMQDEEGNWITMMTITSTRKDSEETEE